MSYQSKQQPNKLELKDESQARNPWLEHYGLLIVLGFIIGYGLLILSLRVMNQNPAQSQLLEGVAVGFQIIGEWIGFAFCLNIALRLSATARLLKLHIMQLNASAASRTEIKRAMVVRQRIHRAWLAWICFAIGIVLYSLARLVWVSYSFHVPTVQIPYPGLYDIGYIAIYPFFLFGIFFLARWSDLAAGGLKSLLDVLMIIAASIALSWFFLLAPTIAGLKSNANPLTGFLSLYFPVADLLLIVVSVMAVCMLAIHSMQPVLWRVGWGLICLAVVDSLLHYLHLDTGLQQGSLLNLLELIALMLIGLAAIEYPRTIEHERDMHENNPETSAGTGILYSGFIPGSILPVALTLGISMLLFLVIAPRSKQDSLLVVLISLTLLAIILLRIFLTNQENMQLAQQLYRESLVRIKVPPKEPLETDSGAREALGKDELQDGIRILQRVHTSVARGDLDVRAPANLGSLLPIGQSLNVMLDRLNVSMMRGNSFDRLLIEMQSLQIVLHQLCQETPLKDVQPLNYPSVIEVQSVMQGIIRLQRVNSDRLHRLSVSLDDMRLPLQHLHQWASISSKMSDAERAQLLSRINELGTRWLNLRSQTDAVIDLTERSVPTARFG